MFNKLCPVLLGSVFAAEGAIWNYTLNGADWPKLDAIEDNQCGGTTQSPINLPTEMDESKIRDSDADFFGRIYTNIIDQSVTFDGSTSVVQYLTPGLPSHFKSDFNLDDRLTSPVWKATKFHFRSGSEHTIDRKRYNLEMQIMHTPSIPIGADNSGYFQAGVGILFDANPEYAQEFSDEVIQTIDDFFDSLRWDIDLLNPKVKEIQAGNLLSIINMKDRWTYKGSLTTPPCSTSVLWNVLTTVYPIKQSHIDEFKTQLARNKDYNLAEVGNFRVAQTINDHDLMMIQSESPPPNLRPAFIVLAVFMVIFLITLASFVIYS